MIYVPAIRENKSFARSFVYRKAAGKTRKAYDTTYNSVTRACHPQRRIVHFAKRKFGRYDVNGVRGSKARNREGGVTRPPSLCLVLINWQCERRSNSLMGRILTVLC